MFLAQVRRTHGMHLVGLADVDVARARKQLAGCGWSQPQYSAANLGDALRGGRAFVTPDPEALLDFPHVDVMIEATGDPRNGIRFALASIAHGMHIVMVNFEDDVVSVLLLAC